MVDKKIRVERAVDDLTTELCELIEKATPAIQSRHELDHPLLAAAVRQAIAHVAIIVAATDSEALVNGD